MNGYRLEVDGEQVTISRDPATVNGGRGGEKLSKPSREELEQLAPPQRVLCLRCQAPAVLVDLHGAELLLEVAELLPEQLEPDGTYIALDHWGRARPWSPRRPRYPGEALHELHAGDCGAAS